MIYRLIFETEPGRVDTGANLPGCSRDNPDACDPKQFDSMRAAYDYASSRGETPVVVYSADEAWNIVEGRTIPDTGFLSNPLVLGIGALVLLAFLRRR